MMQAPAHGIEKVSALYRAQFCSSEIASASCRPVSLVNIALNSVGTQNDACRSVPTYVSQPRVHVAAVWSEVSLEANFVNTCHSSRPIYNNGTRIQPANLRSSNLTPTTS
jgi:hypothetical protein